MLCCEICFHLVLSLCYLNCITFIRFILCNALVSYYYTYLHSIPAHRCKHLLYLNLPMYVIHIYLTVYLFALLNTSCKRCAQPPCQGAGKAKSCNVREQKDSASIATIGMNIRKCHLAFQKFHRHFKKFLSYIIYLYRFT